MIEPEWIEENLVLAIHEAQLAEHGGALGIRDEGLLLSALARPINPFHYSSTTDIRDLAALYAIGVSKNYPFVDGNKRTAWLTCYVFLLDNEFNMSADEIAVEKVMWALSSNQISDEDFCTWIHQNSTQRIG